MSDNKKYILAYCQENQDVAKLIDQDLSISGYKFEHISSGQTSIFESLGDQLISRDANTLLLVSDNFLKSVRCMKNGMDYIQRLSNIGKLLPVIIDGKYPVDGTSDFETLPTVFDRVSHIIKYMNFWQEKYLELRKKKRTISAKEEQEFNQEINIVRSISSNIGEFLRYLRSIKHYNHVAFKENSYKVFFDYSQNLNEHEAYITLLNPDGVVESIKPKEGVNRPIEGDEKEAIGINQDLVNLITNSSEDILAENESIINLKDNDLKEGLAKEVNMTINEPPNEEDAPIDLSTIPGMQWLQKADEESEPKPIDESIKDIAFESSNLEEKDLSVLSENQSKSSSTENVFELDLEDLSKLDAEKRENIEADADTDVDLIIDEILNQEASEQNKEVMEEVFPTVDNFLEKSLLEDNSEPFIAEKSTDEMDDKLINNILLNDEIENDDEFPDVIVLQDVEEELKEIVEEKDATNVLLKESNEPKDFDIVGNSIEEEKQEEVNYSILDAAKKIEEGDHEGGLQVMKALVIANPTDVFTRYQYAYHLARFKNDFENAIKELETVLSFNDKHEDSYFLLAEIAEIQGDYLSAKSGYEKVESLNIDYPNVYYRLGLLLLNKFEDKSKEALHYLKLAVKQNPKNVDAHYRIGILLNEFFGKHWKAVKHFKKTLKIKKDHPFANYDLAVIYHQLGDRAPAYDYYKKAIKINPELRTKQNDEAFKYALMETNAKADSHFKQIMNQEEDPEFTELKKDMERLETSMAKLYPANHLNENESKPIIKQELSAILGEDILVNQKGDTESIETNVVEDQIIEKEQVEEETQQMREKGMSRKKLGKIVFITGATAGFGKAIARLFAEHDYSLILTGRRTERLEEVKTELEEAFNSYIQILPFDVRDLAATNLAFNSLSEEWKNVDVLINNAGLAKGMAPIHEGDFDLWNQMIDTNLKGLLHVTRAITPYMVKRQTGHVINIGSTSGRDVYPNGNVYCASKFAVDGLTRAMRHDLYKYNIRVSQVLPAHAETEFALVRFDGDEEKAKMYEDFEPLKAEDVAQSVYFIATQPPHVNISDVVLWSTQQLSPTTINRSGRIK